MHRIRQFHIEDLLIWDRETRTDLCDMFYTEGFTALERAQPLWFTQDQDTSGSCGGEVKERLDMLVFIFDICKYRYVS